MNATTVLQIAIGLIPTIIPLVKSIETPGFGEEKLQVIKTSVIASLKLLPDDVQAEIKADKIEAFTETVVNTIVSFLNITGAFKKQPDPPKPPDPPVLPPPPTKEQEIARLTGRLERLKEELNSTTLPSTSRADIEAKIAKVEANLAKLQAQ